MTFLILHFLSGVTRDLVPSLNLKKTVLKTVWYLVTTLSSSYSQRWSALHREAVKSYNESFQSSTTKTKIWSPSWNLFSLLEQRAASLPFSHVVPRCFYHCLYQFLLFAAYSTSRLYGEGGCSTAPDHLWRRHFHLKWLPWCMALAWFVLPSRCSSWLALLTVL